MRIDHDRKTKRNLKAVLRASEGSVATIFAVSVIPVMIAAGIGVDLSRSMTSRSHLQDALDATALALAHLPQNTPQATLDAKAATWMAANLRDPTMSAPVVKVKMGKGEILLDASATVETTIMAIANYKEMTVAAHTSVKWGLGHAEVVLVLDNTKSMEGTKLDRLKAAAKSLVDTLEGQISSTDPNVLRVGVVPFSTAVRLSDSSTDLNTYKSATWMTGSQPSAYGDDLFSDKKFAAQHSDRFGLFTQQAQAWGGCVEARPAPYDVQDTEPTTATPATLFVPYFAPDEPDDSALVKSTSKKGKNTYYTSDNNYIADGVTDTDATSTSGGKLTAHLDRWRYIQGYSGKYATKVSQTKVNSGLGPNAGCDMVPLLRLTNSMAAVRTKLTAMKAVGNTNIPIGLMWGWHLLSPNRPFADGVAYTNVETKKFLVLLTDGDNTHATSDNPSNSVYTTLGYAWQKRMSGIDQNTSSSDRTTAMDARMALVCQNIRNAGGKTDGITIYVVRIDVSGTAPTALSGCASSTDKFYNIESSALNTAFQEIAGSIGKLRLAQ